MVLAVVDDLLFSSKIRAVAAASARPVVFVRKREAVMAAMKEHQPDLVLLDLDREALDPISVILEIRSTPEYSGTPMIGFGSHVHVERLQAARSAGCDRTMARSAFVAALPDLLQAAGARTS